MCFWQIDVTVTAKADYAWLWGIQTAVESIFISQAKDDIGAYLQSNIRTCQELVAAGKVSFALLLPVLLQLASVAVPVLVCLNPIHCALLL